MVYIFLLFFFFDFSVFILSVDAVLIFFVVCDFKVKILCVVSFFILVRHLLSLVACLRLRC